MPADVQPKTGNAVELKPHERFVRSLQARAAENANNGSRNREILAGQVNKILAADTDEEFWNADEGGTIAGQDLQDVPMEILGYEITPSSDEYTSDFGVYVNIDATLLASEKGYSAGEKVIVNTGAPLIITKLEAARARDMFPLRCVIKGTKAKNGTVLKLRPLPNIAVSATTA